jgi:serine protease Do
MTTRDRFAFYTALLYSTLLYLCSATSALAMPSDEMVHQLNAQVLRVQVGLANGGYGLGSAVVIAKDQVVTNCHVVADSTNIVVINNGAPHIATAIKPDWHHDLCMLTIENLDAPIAKIGSSKNLKYEESVFTIGYPHFQAVPSSTNGVVKGLYPMDDSVIIRATSSFGLGASGGGVFDDAGNLVGIITLKSPSKNSYYYNMPVEWVQALMNTPEKILATKSDKPFWAASYEKWPYFMQVVQPYLTESWDSLLQIATKWTQQEPSTVESWFYLATAEYAVKAFDKAEAHLQKVVAMNHQHSQAIYYLGLIAEKTGQHIVALNKVSLLDSFDETTATELKLAMGMPEEQGK